MDTFEPPSPLLPDVVTSPTSIPPPNYHPATITGCFQKQQVNSSAHSDNNCQEVNSSPQMHQAIVPTIVGPNDDSVVQMMMDCSMDGASSAMQSNAVPNWAPATPTSSSSTTTFNEYPNQMYLLPPPPSPPPIHIGQQQQISQPPQLPDIVPGKVVEEFEKIMRNENDKVVLTNSVCLLFRFSFDKVRGYEVCQAMSASPDIMESLYYLLLNEQFEYEDLILCYATGNLTNISKYEEGRAAILGCNSYQESSRDLFQPSSGVRSLTRSLQSHDSNVIIFAITAIHNLLLDRRNEIQAIAKAQINHGIKYIVQLLDNQHLRRNYEFKVIVLDCLQKLAYGNPENRNVIRESGGPGLLLRTIDENFDNQPTEELVETASRVLKSLSACTLNKVDIIENGGISVLTHCIERNNHEILKTCLWTLRNLSDVIKNTEPCINQLVRRLLHILDEYAEEPCMITCALGILANLTCNNEAIKQLICELNGIDLLLYTISIALRDGRDFCLVEVLEPAVCALCHLMNQTRRPRLAEDARKILDHLDLFKLKTLRGNSPDLSKAVEKLYKLCTLILLT